MASFEERLTTLSSAENLKKAKNLLKQKALFGAWRNTAGQLCGIFRENTMPEAVVAVNTGENTSASCSCGDEHVLCPHAVALLMYSGRFKVNDGIDETPPFYTKGLLMQSFDELSHRGMKNSAQLRLNVVEDQLHAPNQYKILLLSARLFGTSREYAGNLNNLRQLYFEKSLSVVLKYEDFSLHDQQIIRFLALNGEADNSNIALGAELTAELFHSLPGFNRFFRNGNRIIVRPERSRPVLVQVKDQLMPGISFGNAALPMTGARLIAGRGGSWVGKNDEYFFIGGDCEAGFLRSFFRAAPRKNNAMLEFPLPVMKADSIEPEGKKVSVMIDARFDENNIFSLKTSYLYDFNGQTIISSPHSGRIAVSQNKCFARDIKAERQFENDLALFGMDICDENFSAVLNDPEKAGLFLDHAIPEIILRNPGKIVFSSRAARIANGGNGVPMLDFHCSLAGKSDNACIINYQLRAGEQNVSFEKLAELAAEKKNYLPHHGKIFRIHEQLGRLVRSSSVLISNINTASCTFELPFINHAAFCAIAGRIPGTLPVELITAIMDSSTVTAVGNYSFNGTLRNYQQHGVNFMQFLTDRNFNPLLADEMGLGKTVQLLALLASRMTKNGSPSLIVCPASLVVNWSREAARFVPEFRVAAPLGNDREKILADGNFDLLILSYNAAKICKNSLKKYHFQFLVLDEAQHIKNPGSSNAKNCKSIHAAHRIVLTGTPLENAQEELWSVMDFLQPGMLGTLPAFKRRYANIANSSELQEEFTGRIAPFIKRRTKAEVASDLPEKNEITMFCEMSPAQRKLYNGILADSRKSINSAGNAEIFALLLRLRQCCCHPALLSEFTASSEENSAKTDLLFELLNETIDSGHKVLLFSQFTSMLKLFIPRLETAGIPFEYLDGTTRDRQKHVDNFNNDPDIPLFLLSLKAGGTGLNLTSADTVIIYDPWWNPAVELQAADRTHRIGQTRTVSTIKLVMKDSVEEKVLALQQKKQELFQTLVENPASAKAVSLAELRALLD